MGVAAGFAPAGAVVVVAAGFVAGVVVVVAAGLVPAGAAVVAAAPLPVALPFPCGVPEVPAGVATAGAVVGNDVSGVGSGGNGVAKTPAINCGIPSVLSAFRNLYQVVRLSFQPVFAVAKLASLAASATARA